MDALPRRSLKARADISASIALARFFIVTVSWSRVAQTTIPSQLPAPNSQLSPITSNLRICLKYEICSYSLPPPSFRRKKRYGHGPDALRPWTKCVTAMDRIRYGHGPNALRPWTECVTAMDRISSEVVPNVRIAAPESLP